MKYDVDFIEALRSARDRLSELNTPLPERNPVSAVGPFETTVEPATPAPAPAPQSAFSDGGMPTFTPKLPNPAGVLQSIGAFDFLDQPSAAPAPQLSPREPALSPPYQMPREEKPVSAFDFAEPEQPPAQAPAAPPSLGILGESFGMLTPEEQKAWIVETKQDALNKIAESEKAIKDTQAYIAQHPGVNETVPSVLAEPSIYDDIIKQRKSVIEEQREKLANIEAIERGEKPPATKSGLRAGVESTVQSLGTTLIGAPVKFAGIVQGYAKNVAGSEAAPDEASIYQTGKQIDDFVRQVFPGDEARADEFGQKLSHGIGSLTAFYGTGALQTITRLGPKAFHRIAQSLPFLLGGTLSSTQHFDAATEKMKDGKPVSEADRAKATATGFALGLTEALPVTATMKAASTMKKGATAAQKVKNVGTQAAIGAAEEGAQEFGQSVASDITAREFYDPERKIGETAAEEGLIGTLLGGVARGTTTAISELRGEKKPKKDKPAPEPEPEAAPVAEEPVSTETAVEEEAAEDVFEELPDDEIATPAKPATVEKAGDLDEVAAVVDTEPSEAQKEAGNYRKATVKLTPKGLGVKVAIETPKGAERRGVDADGKEWSATAQAHYGYIKGEEGKDGDAVDIFLGPDLKSQEVTVVNQIDPKTGKLDEHKILYGFKDQEAAEKAYRGSYSDKVDRVGSIYTVPVAEFKGWLKDGDKRKEFAPAEVSTADPDPRFALTRKPAKVAPEGAPDAETTVLERSPAKSRKPSGADRSAAGKETAGRTGLSKPVGPRGELQGKDAAPAPSNEAFEVPGFRGEFKDLSPVEGGLARRRYSLYPEGSGKNAKPVATMHVRQASNGRGFVYDVEAPGSGAKLYDQVEKHFGVKLQPSGLLTESGFKFWKKRDPETVKWHQWSAEEEMYLSPRQLLERREEGSATQEIDDLWEGLPADAQIAAADGDAMFALRGFQGSPYDFDRFDLSKIGTGTGYQEEASGIYLSSAERVGEGYRISLTEDRLTMNGEVITDLGIRSYAVAKLEGRLDLLEQSDIALRERLADLEGLRPGQLEAIDQRLADIALVKAANIESPGILYEVEVDVERAQLADWDAKLADQTEGVQAFFARRGIDEQYFSDAYRSLSEQLGGSDRASAALNEAGVPGVRFIGDSGAENYVIFDDSLVTITKKNGKPVAADERQDVIDQMFALRSGSVTETEAFKRWFKDSKVVDENGEPLVVYHGTRQQISDDFAFDPARHGSATDDGWLGQGFYFTREQDVAEAYGPNVAAVYLAIKNPYYFPDNVNPVRFVDEMGGPAPFTEWVKSQGHDGIISTAVLKQIVAFEPTQIKSAIGNRGTFDPNDPRISFALRGFYSPAIRATEQLKQERGTGQQFWSMITKAPGVRKDELEWMGLEEFLAGKKSITKDEVLSFMRAHQVELDEKILSGAKSDRALISGTVTPEQFRRQTGADEAAFPDAEIQFIEKFSVHGSSFYVVKRLDSSTYTVLGLGLEEIGEAASRAQAEHMGQGWAASKNTGPRFSGDKVPGGENYRELLIRLPELGEIKFTAADQKRLDAVHAELDRLKEQGLSSFDPRLSQAQDEVDRLLKKKTQPAYESRHFHDQEIVHLRVDDRVGPNGEKILFVNEIQSDLHQKGRKQGYGKPKLTQKQLQLRLEIADISKAMRENPAGSPEWMRAIERERELRSDPEFSAATQKLEGSRMPDAPFKGDLWLELALKRALLYASENGYDAVSWARGDQIAKAVDGDAEALSVQYDQKIGRFLSKYTKKWGGKVEEADLKIENQDSSISPSELDNDIAFYALRQREDNPADAIEFLRGEPDDYVVRKSQDNPNAINEAIAVLEKVRAAGGVNPLLRLTPEMRSSVMEGQPLAIGNGKRGYRLTAEAANNREEIFAAVEAEINRMAPGVKVRFKDLPQGVEGAYVKSLTSIFVALKANDPKAIGDHEVIHAVRALNIINDAEWSTLKAAAIKNDWLEKHNVPDEYSARFNDLVQRGELTEEQALDQMYEEAVAWEFAEWRKGKRPASTAWQRLFQRLNAFINRIMRALKGQDIEAYEQVFENIAKGPEARQRDLARERAAAQNRSDIAERIMARIGGVSVEDVESALDFAEARFAGAPRSERPRIDKDISDAYKRAQSRNRPDNKWVYLEDLRKELPEHSREEVDAALKRLMIERRGGVTAIDLTIQDDQGSLTEGQRAAATRFGASRQDMISIDPSSPLLDSQALDQQAPQRVEDFDDDAAFALSGRRTPSSALGKAYEEFYDGYAGLEPESRRYMRNRSRSYFQRAAGAFGSQLQSIRNTWQDNFLPVRRLEEAQKREQQVDLPDDMRPYMREELYHSRLQTRIEDFEEQHVEPLKKAIAESGIDLEQLEVYLYARHAEERNKQIASINPKMQDGGSGMSTADARIVLQSVQNSGKAKDYDRIAQMVYAINDAKLDQRVAYGLMTQDEADTLRKTYKSYVPLKGDPQHDDERTPPRVNVPKGFSVTNKDMVRAMGRKSRAHDLISRSVQDYLETMVRGERNRVAQALYEMLKAHPMPDVALIDTPKMKRFIDKRTGMQTALVANAPVQTAKQFKEMVKEQADPLAFLDPNTMSVMVNGERHTIRFLKPELRDAMMNVGITQGMGLMKAAWAFNRWIAMMATSLNPSFALPNFIRDFQAAGINLMAAGHKKAFRRVAKNSVRGMKAIIAVETGGGTGQWADLYRELKRTGGTTGFYSMKDWEKQQKQLARDVRLLRAGLLNPERRANALWKGFKDVVGGFNNVFENATRLAAYKIALESGLSKEKAASIAKNITVNFNRRGRLDTPASKMVLAMYLFANPSIQGSHRLSKAFKDATPARRYGILASLVGLGAMTALYNVLIGAALGDDEEKNIYETTSDYDRANNWLFLNPFAERKEGVSGRDAVAFKIPMPYGYGAIVNLGRLLMEHAIYQNTDLLKEERTAGKTFGEIVSIAHGHFDPLGAHPNPLAAFSPTIAKPFVEMYTNTKFHGGPVYPMSFDPSEPDTDLAFRTTPDAYKQIARWINGLGGGDEYHKGKLLGVETDFSPETLKHLWTFGIGGLGNEIARMFTMGERQYVTKEPIRLNDIPIIRRFVSDEVGWGYSNDYYAIRDEKMKPYEDVRRDAAKGSQAAKDILPNLELEKRLYAIYKKSDKLLSKYRKDIKANDKARDDGKITTEVWARQQQDIYDLRQLATMRFMVEYYAERQMLDLERDQVTAPSFKAKARSLINRRRERARYNISAIEQSIKGGDMHGKPPVTDLSKIKRLADKLREGGGLLSPIAEFVD